MKKSDSKQCRPRGIGARLMVLTMRPTGLKPPADLDRADYTVYSNEWAMGRIYEMRGAPEAYRWHWSLHGLLGKPSDMHTEGHAATLLKAKAELETVWRQWLVWAGLGEM